MSAAPLSTPKSTRKPLKRSATPSLLMSTSASNSINSRGKRPRPSLNSNDDIIEPSKKKDLNKFSNGSNGSNGNGNGIGSLNGLGLEANAMRKGMYLAFIDDAFTKRNKVNIYFYFSFFFSFFQLFFFYLFRDITKE